MNRLKKLQRNKALAYARKNKTIPPFFTMDKMDLFTMSEVKEGKVTDPLEEGEDFQDAGDDVLKLISGLFSDKKIPAGFLPALIYEFLPVD